MDKSTPGQVMVANRGENKLEQYYVQARLFEMI